LSTLALRGRIVVDGEVWDGGSVLVEGGKIRAVERGPLTDPLAEAADELLELPGGFLVPGFVELQINGAFGVDVATDPERLRELSAKLPTTGTTSYLPTLVSLPLAEYPLLLPRLAREMGRDAPGARPLGLHLEGPFLNPKKKGAHLPENTAQPDAPALAAMIEAGPVRMVTLAPELPGALDLVGLAVGRGVLVSLGHSAADGEAARAALDAGARGVTHLFNAMGPLHHRKPGLPGVALSDPRATCGLIVDGRHLHPDVVRVAFAALGPERIYLTTDAIAAAGMGSGQYALAGRRVGLEDGVPRLEDGTIAGSVLLMDQALHNVVEFARCTLPEAVKMASTTPARIAGVGHRKGRIAPGYDADLVMLAAGTLEVEAAWVGGVRC
jgi:N-acetylglucosamine-6-phosphate deacetylase